MTDTPGSGLDDLFSFLDDDSLTIPKPIPSEKYPEGKIYTIPAPDAHTGLRLSALADIAAKQQRGVRITDADAAKLRMDDEEEREFAVQVMGNTYHEMMEDGVSWPRIQKVIQYAYIYFAMGKDVAEAGVRDGLLTGGNTRIPAYPTVRREQLATRTLITP